MTSEEQNKVKRMKRIEGSLRILWSNIKWTNIQIIGDQEEEEINNTVTKIKNL